MIETIAALTVIVVGGLCGWRERRHAATLKKLKERTNDCLFLWRVEMLACEQCARESDCRTPASSFKRYFRECVRRDSAGCLTISATCNPAKLEQELAKL